MRRSTSSTRLAGALTLLGLLGVVIGLYGLLDATSPAVLGAPLLVAGAVSSGAALAVGARRDPRTRYRRDPWAVPEWLVAVCGAVPAAVMSVAAGLSWGGVVPQQVPLALPAVPLALVAAVAVGALPAWVAPLPPLLAQTREARA